MKVWRMAIASPLCAGCAILTACAPTGIAPRTPTAFTEAGNATAALLYLSDWRTNQVFVYDYSTHSAAGRLTGLRRPSGECVDAAHHVWIAELLGSRVVEYAHGGATPIAHLQTAGYPIGCAVDPTTGNLAVANFYRKSASGTIQVWAKAAGAPKTFAPTKLYYLWPPAYDNNGNLFAEGRYLDGTTGVTELARAATELRSVTLRGAAIHFAGGAFWDGTHVGLTDQSSANGGTTVLYRMHFDGAVGSVVGRTHLADTCDHGQTDVAAPFVFGQGAGTRVIGGNLSCARRVDYWSYPAGGDPHSSLPGAPLEPFGAAVSPSS
jgi:hypothetical protein